MKAIKTRSKILQIKDDTGIWVDESAQVENNFFNDFKARFKFTWVDSIDINMEVSKLASQEDNEFLLKPIEDSKIKEVICQIQKFKALGPDGFGAAFFQLFACYS